jgi:hypothetical protein
LGDDPPDQHPSDVLNGCASVSSHLQSGSGIGSVIGKPASIQDGELQYEEHYYEGEVSISIKQVTDPLGLLQGLRTCSQPSVIAQLMFIRCVMKPSRENLRCCLH